MIWYTLHVNQSSYIWLVQGLFLCFRKTFAQRYQMWIYNCHSCLDLEIYGYGSTCFFRKTCIFLETTIVTILAYWKNFLKFDNEVLTSVYNDFSNFFHFQIGSKPWLFLHTFFISSTDVLQGKLLKIAVLVFCNYEKCTSTNDNSKLFHQTIISYLQEYLNEA